MAFFRVQSAFEQSAENGRFDLAPVVARRPDQQFDLFRLERNWGDVFEQVTVELQKLGIEHPAVAATLHGLPQRTDGSGKMLGRVLQTQ